RRVQTQRRQLTKEKRACLLFRERGGEPERASHADAPVARELRDVLDMRIAIEDGGGGPGAPAEQTWITVRAVADEREPVGDRYRWHAELPPDRRLIAHLARAAVELDDALTAHALGEVLVRRADDDLLDPRVRGGHGGG